MGAMVVEIRGMAERVGFGVVWGGIGDASRLSSNCHASRQLDIQQYT